MKHIISGVSVYTSGDPKNQSIIFVHGFPYDHTMWNFQIEFLQEQYFCVTYDIRGLGESTVGDGQYTLEFFVEDLFNIIKVLNLYKPVLCGLSMGGYIALRAVERNQELFKALILCDTKADADDNSAKLKRSENINIINTQGLVRFNDLFITNCFAEETPKEQEKLFLETLYKAHKNNPIGVKGAMIAIMSRTDTTSFLPNIILPTILICGAFDKLTPPPVMRFMGEKIPDSEFAAIPQAGHMTPLENPGCVNDIIKGFLERRL
jgi:3-oxoadipate enol-lactonase